MHDTELAAAAATLAATMAQARMNELSEADGKAKEDMIASYYGWALDIVRIEHSRPRSGSGGNQAEIT